MNLESSVLKISSKLSKSKLTKNFILFLLLSFCYIACSYIINKYILNIGLLYNTYSDYLIAERIEDMNILFHKYQWISFALTPLFLFLKVFIISLIIYSGIIFSKVNISSNAIFKIVLTGEIVFVISIVSNTIFMLYSNNFKILQDVQVFQIFSILSALDSTLVPKWAIYPLKTLNLFEVAYVIFIAHLLKSYIPNLPFIKAFSVVSVPYFSGLLLWVVFITFLTVSIGG